MKTGWYCSFLGGDLHLQPLELTCHAYLARQAGCLLPRVGAVQQRILIVGHFRQTRHKRGIYVYVAGGAGTAASTQRAQLGETSLANRFHERAVLVSFYSVFCAVTRDNHDPSHSPASLRRLYSL